jgi:uncharacterized protein with PIN domain
MTKRELQQELRKLKKKLKDAEELLMRAAANVESMMALQDENERLRKQERHARKSRSN